MSRAAAHLLTREASRIDIKIIARALLERGKLSGAQVSALLRQRADVSGQVRL